MDNRIATSDGREVWLDWTRVLACLMVMVVHATEPFYLGGEGAQILTRAEGLWAALFDTLVRSCVPIFVVVSAWLQFPVRRSTGDFLRRRAVRILVPFAVWTAVYACIWGEPAANFKNLLLNFNYASGHLWYVYMLIGLYLLMPLLSPWAERVGKRELQCYLGLWLLTTLLPFVRDWAGEGVPPMIYGSDGLPRQALYPLWGEASWNAYGTFYYFSGFIGYLLLGLYMRRFVAEKSWGRTLAFSLPCFAASFAICFAGFWRRVEMSAGGTFPVGGEVGTGAWWETAWCNDTLGVALMTMALIPLLRKITSDGAFYRRVVLPVSKASYGMYLCHMIVLASVSSALCGWLGRGDDVRLGVWSAPVEIVLTALCSFVIVAAVSVLVQRIPKIGKYIMG